MTEPGDLWVERLDRKFRENAPRVVKREGASGLALSAPYVFVGPGLHPLTVAGIFASGRPSAGAAALPPAYCGISPADI